MLHIVLTGIEYPENENSCDEDNKAKANNLVQILVNGMMFYKKYYFIFNFTKEKIKQMEINENLEKLKNIIRTQTSIKFKLQEEDIEIYNYPLEQKIKFKLMVFIKNKKFRSGGKEILSKLKKELTELEDVKQTNLMDGIILNKFFLDVRGDNQDGGWGVDEKRGNEDYYPPRGWIKCGVKVFNQYDNGNNDWLSYEGGDGEWCIAYHGINPKIDINSAKKFSENNDIKNPGQKVGTGVFCVQNPENLETDCGEVVVGDEEYAIAFMLRVKPSKIRVPEEDKNIWVVNGIPEELRPYGILFKKKN